LKKIHGGVIADKRREGGGPSLWGRGRSRGSSLWPRVHSKNRDKGLGWGDAVRNEKAERERRHCFNRVSEPVQGRKFPRSEAR